MFRVRVPLITRVCLDGGALVPSVSGLMRLAVGGLKPLYKVSQEMGITPFGNKQPASQLWYTCVL